MDLPDLTEIQKNSYGWFVKEGLKEIFNEINPVKDFTEKLLELKIVDYRLDKPKYSEKQAKKKNATFEAPLKSKVSLLNKETGEIKEQEIYMGDFPLMTERGTFIINGVERVVVSQLIRSPGVSFSGQIFGERKFYGAKVIPNRGAWLEIETDKNGVITARIDRKRKVAITSLLRAFGYGTDQEIFDLFKDIDNDPEFRYIEATIKKDTAKSVGEGLKAVYRKIRPGDLATEDNARSLIHSMFFNLERYDLGKVGRFKLNQRLNLSVSNTARNRIFRKEDLVAVVRELIQLNKSQGLEDDIDHLGNRRVKAVGELVQQKFRLGLSRMVRIIKDRMSTADITTVTPALLINVRPIVAAMHEFFSSSQLSQFMDQTNPLAELEHKRRISTMGPGGLSRDRAGMEVRDVHRTHYGRICPIETPEGPNIGLINNLACLARLNEYGFLETPYRKVVKEVENKASLLEGKVLSKDIKVKEHVVFKKDSEITKTLAKEIEKLPFKKVRIRRFVSEEIEYLDAHEEEGKTIGPAKISIDKKGYFLERHAEVRVNGEPRIYPTSKIDYLDVSPQQIVSISSALIPFLEHDDANRALMGSNMQRQAVSTIKPDAPIVGTGMEKKAAKDSGHLVVCRKKGKVIEVDADHIKVLEEDGNIKDYDLFSFERSNVSTCLNQKPLVEKGDKVSKGHILADGASTDEGELALGQNLLVAFMSWGGGNYEDAILVSERVVEQDKFTSIHIEDHIVDIREIKLGSEVVTRDIPNVGELKLKDLDEEGIVRIGAKVGPGDILVGKITPKGETELTAEERLLKAIFGEEAKDVKDTSLRLPHGEHGKVVDIKIFTREQGDKLESGVIKRIQVSVANLKKIQVGDKLAGHHGNKGVISKIVPVEDIPCLPNGQPVDIILNPLGVASRMNIGQLLETHLGWAAKNLGYKVATPVFNGVSLETIKKELKKAGLPEDGKVQLIDGRTGEFFKDKTTVGIIYILKLEHLVEEKMHARSTGPYSLVTQQPLGGKAQFGGQRFGEMEVWALEAYGAAHTLQEMLTIKSDDVLGRARAYESIVKGEKIQKPHIPASFGVLIKELQGLG
ncbi:DNA-directed RNA polymerase subunit beta, partial [bacterium (Candidatus Torokbacteria) CG_4_10_14_0_2_um_filter_35_8]